MKNNKAPPKGGVFVCGALKITNMDKLRTVDKVVSYSLK